MVVTTRAARLPRRTAYGEGLVVVLRTTAKCDRRPRARAAPTRDDRATSGVWSADVAAVQRTNPYHDSPFGTKIPCNSCYGMRSVAVAVPKSAVHLIVNELADRHVEFADES